MDDRFGGNAYGDESCSGAFAPCRRIFASGKLWRGFWRYFEHAAGSAADLRMSDGYQRCGCCNVSFKYHSHAVFSGIYPENSQEQCTDTVTENVYGRESYSGRGFKRRFAELSHFHDGDGFQYGAQQHHCRIFQCRSGGNGDCKKTQSAGFCCGTGDYSGNAAPHWL